MPDDALTYRAAGVNIDAGQALVERIKRLVKRTFRAEVMAGPGGFSGLFALGDRYRDPVLVAGTDGVGTKLKLAQQLDRHDTIGIDLVAMCVNDVLVQGAEPLFFLDYFATGTLDLDTASTVVNGIARGCELAGCALMGGETAEMPAMYATGEYDLAGFSVGVVEKAHIISGQAIIPGDCIVGIASSGPHANGYSLIRRIIERHGDPVSQLARDLDGICLADALMAPTTIYVKPMLALLASQGDAIHGMAHITGGGLRENIIRVVPDGMGLTIDRHAIELPPVFDYLRCEGQLALEEMWRTFNCGVGFTVILPASAVDATATLLTGYGLASKVIGEVIRVKKGDERVHIG